MNGSLKHGSPKLGLALSGAAQRSVFYIGFLESMEEAGIEFDYIVACSSACIVAACYACKTLPLLKERALSLNKEFMFSLFERSQKGGYYNLDKGEETLRVLTRNLRFEDVRPLMGFVGVDLEKGEQVVLSMGDIAHAARISCTLPGIFEPVQWGSRMLIDGGLLNIMPVDVARQAGMDVVVGINMRGTSHIFTKNQMRARQILKLFKKIFLIDRAERLYNWLYRLFVGSDFLSYFPSLEEIARARPGMFTVLGRAIDLAIEAEKHDNIEALKQQCDIFIRPSFENLGLTNFSQIPLLYELGRSTGREYAPQIKQAVAEHQDKRQRQPQRRPDSIKVV